MLCFWVYVILLAIRFPLKLSFLVWLFLHLVYGSNMMYYVKALQLKWITKGFRKLICILSMFWERGFTHWAVVAHSHYFFPFPRFTGMWQLRGAPRVELLGLCCHSYVFVVYCRLWLERLQSYVNSLFLVSLWMIANSVYSGCVARRVWTPACSRWAVVGCWFVLQGYNVRL